MSAHPPASAPGKGEFLKAGNSVKIEFAEIGAIAIRGGHSMRSASWHQGRITLR